MIARGSGARPDQVRLALAGSGACSPQAAGSIAGAEFEHGAFAPARYTERRLEQPYRLLEETLERVVVVGRVVVEQDHLLRTDARGELERVAIRAVAPANAAGVLLIGKLGIVDQEIGARGQLIAPTSIPARAIGRPRRAIPGSWSGR